MKFDINKILAVAKKQWALILMGVLVLAAIVALFTFVDGQRDALQAALGTHKQVYDDMTKLLTKERHQPVVSLDPNAAAPPLQQFPNQPIIDNGVQAIKGVSDQSFKLKSLTDSMNVHQLLVPGSLPQVGDAFRFQRIYLQEFEKNIPTKLQSVTPPTADEITARATEETTRITNAAPHDAQGNPFDKNALQHDINDMLTRLPDKMRSEAATKHKLYMTAAALSIHPALAPVPAGGVQVQPTAEQIWMAQMGIWIQQDVTDSIAVLNKSSKQISESVVKQVVQIYVPSDRSIYAIPGVAPGTAVAAPAAGQPAPSAVAASSDTDPFPKDYTVSPTGRVCNGVFDVVHFTICLTVQAGDVEKVIQELERRRLLTVYQVDIQSVNSAAAQQDGFYFGRTPVVTLTLNCEELFMRDWTRQYMPPDIKQFLNVQEPGATGQPTAMAQ